MFKRKNRFVVLALLVLINGCATDTPWYSDVPFYKQPATGEFSDISIYSDHPLRVYLAKGEKYPNAQCVNAFKNADTLWVDQVLPKDAGSKVIAFKIEPNLEKYILLSDVDLGMYHCSLGVAFTPRSGHAYKVSYTIDSQKKTCLAVVESRDANKELQAVSYRTIPYLCSK